MSTIDMTYHRAMQSTEKGKRSRAASDQRLKSDPGRAAWALLFRLLQAEGGTVQAVRAELQLTAAQAHLLQRLEAGKPVPMIGLADTLQCDASNVTGLVDKLEARGFLERRFDPADRRVRLIALTPAGERCRAMLLDRLSKPLPFIEAMSRKDKVALLDILERAERARAR
jgi:DNA-binding MarR family transcriptional regulator